MRYTFLLFFFFACSHPAVETTLSSIHIVDRNGFAETISSVERLKSLQTNDFFAPQPYKKITRTLKKNSQGKVPSIITTYHSNGQLWQYLEVLDGRAFGRYAEFFPSGRKRLEASVIEGEGDLNAASQDDWVFDGKSLAWNDASHLVADISYKKGYLDGLSSYYSEEGILLRTVPYHSGKIHGTAYYYDSQGNKIGFENYQYGLKHGLTQFEGDDITPTYRENYQNDCLLEGTYFDLKGQCISEIRNGNGEKVVFDAGKLLKKIQYQGGRPQGFVKFYAPDGNLSSEHQILNGKKHGEEWIYYKNGHPKMLISWYEDEIHGSVKTWFENGVMESQRELCHNERHGHSFAYYNDGSIMLIEEYDGGRLDKGRYMQKGSKDPISTIKNGQGFAALHDANGLFLKKIEYKNGRPVE